MKRTVSLLVLCCSIAGMVCAQDKTNVTNEDKTFELPADKITRRFQVDLDKGNKMQVELIDIADLERIGNADSLVRDFLQNLAPLKDSLSDDLLYKRIDYVIETAPAKKIRIRQGRPNSTSYVIQQGEAAALKLEQDTINLAGSTGTGKNKAGLSYRISFFMNSWSELEAYADGRLNEKLRALKQNYRTNWTRGKDGRMHLTNDPAISAKMGQGLFDMPGDMLALTAAAGAQNYKNYFAPSFSLGATVTTSIISRNSRIKREIGIYWEPMFFFGKNSNGKLTTYRNDFLTLSYGQGPEKRVGRESSMLFIFSVGYLVHREGDYVAPHTIRIGAGRLSLFEGKTKLEPMLYFNDFFKGVTPGIRLMQYF